MKKKLGGIVIVMLVIGSSISFLNGTSGPVHRVRADAPVAQEQCGCEDDQTLMDQTTLQDLYSMKETIQHPAKPLIQSQIPPSFSWRDVDGQDWTTVAKDQGDCGSCWDFAAMGALESIIQIREGCPGLNLDLSEQYVLSCLHAAGSCKGGWAFRAYYYIKNNGSAGNLCNGIIPEFCLQYQVNDDVPCANVSPGWIDFLIPISTYGYWVSDGSIEDRNAIKTQIMDLGPVVATMLFTYYPHGQDNLQEWGWSHHNPSEYYPYPGEVSNTNHQVVLVGWKDDASIPHGGYWIVKNSLSEEWGYDGFFNLEYGSLNIDSTYIDWVDYNQQNFSNWVPLARINTSGQGQMMFDGSGSFDHEGAVVSYHWDFGDGSTAPGVTASHTYETPGAYQVTLSVTDNANNTGMQSVWVFVDTQNHPPKTPKLTGRRYGTNDTAYQYSFSATDPDGDDVYYYLNWGDTYWDGGAVGWIGPYKSGEKVTLEKTWAEKANYTVRVKAKDRYDAKSEWATLPVKIPVSSQLPLQGIWARLCERFPFLFAVLQQILG
jgi:C1A family cysteine protease